MRTHRVRAVFVGAAFLIAMVTSIAGGAVLESVLTPGGGVEPVATSMLRLGVALEMVNVIAVVAIAIALFPLFRRTWDDVALGYVGLRLLEATFLALAALVPVVVASLERQETVGGSADVAATFAPATALLALRSDILAFLIPMFFAAGAVLLYAWMWHANVVPRFVSAWGLIGVVGIVLANLFDLGTGATMALALPIIANEIFLGAWLILRGFGAGDAREGRGRPPRLVTG